MPKPGGDPSSGISLGDVLRLPERHPAYRRREAQPGSRADVNRHMAMPGNGAAAYPAHQARKHDPPLGGASYFARVKRVSLGREQPSQLSRPHKSLVELRAAYMPDAARAVSGHPQADPGGRVTPRFWHRLIRFRHFIGGSLALASLNLACRDHVPTFPQRSPHRF